MYRSVVSESAATEAILISKGASMFPSIWELNPYFSSYLNSRFLAVHLLSQQPMILCNWSPRANRCFGKKSGWGLGRRDSAGTVLPQLLGEQVGKLLRETVQGLRL